MKKICIIIPAYNEEENIISVISSIKDHSDVDIVVIDDGSKDLTPENAKEAGAIIVSHPFNMGYGVALQTGYKYAVKNDYDFLLQMDGDGQHDPKYIPDLLKPVENLRRLTLPVAGICSIMGFRVAARAVRNDET